MQFSGKVIAVACSAEYKFSKPPVSSIELIEGQGIRGDAHCGATVKHRSRVAADPSQPNLRQVHLMHSELFEELANKGFSIAPGYMGENITTHGIDLLALPRDTLFRVGEAELRITGLRNPCNQLNLFQLGLMQAVLDKAEDGTLIRKAGIMAIVTKSGFIHTDDEIKVELPKPPFLRLERV
jgi:MOSC domain-containing protein YiiM